MKIDMWKWFLLQKKSFRQTLKSVENARESSLKIGLANLTEASIWTSVKSTITNNLQRVRAVPTDRSTWAYSIVNNRRTKSEGLYLDVRLFVHISCGIESCHVLSIPINKSHTELESFDYFWEWRNLWQGSYGPKSFCLLQQTSASNITCLLMSALTQFEENNSLVFLIWCAAHQLVVVFQHVMREILKDFYCKPLVSIILYLQRQILLRASMNSTWPLSPRRDGKI